MLGLRSQPHHPDLMCSGNPSAGLHGWAASVFPAEIPSQPQTPGFLSNGFLVLRVLQWLEITICFSSLSARLQSPGLVLLGQKLPTGDVDYTHCYIEFWSQTRDTTGPLVSPTSLGWFIKERMPSGKVWGRVCHRMGRNRQKNLRPKIQSAYTKAKGQNKRPVDIPCCLERENKGRRFQSPLNV